MSHKHDLDFNAGGPVDPRVLERFLEVERDCPGNPGSLHGTGRRARAALEDARQEAAAALGVEDSEIVFLSGGTEANNLAVSGSGDPELPVLLADVEHPSVREAALRRGCVWWSVDPSGRAVVLPPERKVGLVCLVHGQNEIGTLQPVTAAGAVARDLGAPLHVDAAQTLGRTPLRDPLEHAGTIALSCHKAGGLKGIGILVVRGGPGTLRPALLGGGQEGGLRPGTPSPALAASAARTVALAAAEQEHRAQRMHAARTAFLAELAASGTEPVVLTPMEISLPNTLMVVFERIDGRNLLPALDLAGIHASQGSACSSGSPTPPRVLVAMGLTDVQARRCVRFSFAPDDTTTHARSAARTVAAVVSRLRETPRQSPRTR